MSPENLFKLSHRYGQLAAAGFRARVESQRSTVEHQGDFSGNKGSVPALAKSAPQGSEPTPPIESTPQAPRVARFTVPRGESSPEVESGPSKNKGKGFDPRNWGAIDFSENFSETELHAQREALENFKEIRQQVKSEPKSTPVGFFDNDFEVEPENPGLNFAESPPTVVVSTPPRKSGEQNSGQSLSDEISSAKKHLKELKRRQKSHKVNKSTSKAEDAVRDSVMQQMHIEPQKPVNEGPKKRSSKSVAGRLPPGAAIAAR
ncbi:hypothetical protein B0H13DRAFT_1914926 [Mycena leptocephala]|nr:hypothetical protein B0H13DRAFT_1914926 [Mycena leptocephala]